MASGPVRLDQAKTTYWKFFIYGPPGVGKTWFWAGTSLRVFALDCDGRINSARVRRRQLGLPMDRVTAWQTTTEADFDEGINWFHKNIRSFDLIVVDSSTAMHRQIGHELYEKNKSDQHDKQDWGIVRKRSEDMVLWFKGLPVHVIWTAHEILKFVPDFGKEAYRPSFDGRFAYEYAQHFDMIGRLRAYEAAGPAGADGKPTKVMARAVDFGPSADHVYKDCSDLLSGLQPANFDYLLSHCIASTTEPAQENTNAQAR
jgi:hypothetical protein